MFEWLSDAQLHYGYLIKQLIVGTLVSIVCSVIGCFIVLRRMAFLADAIAHSMLAGVIAGYLVMKIFFGQEAHLARLGRYLDEQTQGLAANTGAVNDTMMMVMVV